MGIQFRCRCSHGILGETCEYLVSRQENGDYIYKYNINCAQKRMHDMYRQWYCVRIIIMLLYTSPCDNDTHKSH